jgi:hypothetical protein
LRDGAVEPVKTLVDATLRREAERFAFRFECEDCAHFDGLREQCSLSYPAGPRRSALLAAELVLCKTFELR